MVVIKIETEEYFAPPAPTPLPWFIHISVVAVANGYTAARYQETRKDTVIVPSENIIIFILEWKK